MTQAVIKSIPAKDTRPLRQQILRPECTVEQLVYPGDDQPESGHLGAFVDDTLVGILSWMPEAPLAFETQANITLNTEAHWIRLRGVAVLESHQGIGIGKTLVDSALQHIQTSQKKTSLVWCTARKKALPLYIKTGFILCGDEFEIKGIGPHFYMERPV